jgi:hypothetical protein
MKERSVEESQDNEDKFAPVRITDELIVEEQEEN